MRNRVAHLLVVFVGLLVLAYPLTIGAATEPSCRGVPMSPGDSCAKADNSGVQTYEQRVADRRQAAPVIIVVGVLVTAFGVSLLVADTRRSARRGSS